MSQQQTEVSRPVVVIFAGERMNDVCEYVTGRVTCRDAELIYGTRPIIVKVEWSPQDAWWFNPEETQFMDRLTQLQPDMTRTQLGQWVKSEQFERFAKECILKKSHGPYREVLPEGWQHAVRLVVWADEFVNSNGFTRRVFDELFPIAAVARVTQENVRYEYGSKEFELPGTTLDHNWRETPIEKLGLTDAAVKALKAEDITTVGQVVEMSTKQLGAVNKLSKTAQQQIVDRLDNLGLGMWDD